MNHNAMYEEAVKPPRTPVWQALHCLWLVAGLSSLILFAWAEPFTTRLFSHLLTIGISPILVAFVLRPLVMILRAVLLVESVGYVYHRFFQHVGFMTRQSQVFRRNQRFHWIHHMIIYPIGRVYKRRVPYVPSEHGIALSWVLPGLMVAGLFALTNGINLATAVFLLSMAGWAKLIVDETHSRFHEINHSWANSAYFQWLEKIHVLHHWDQRTNYTIVHPLMDMLFGTYLSPRTHEAELQVALEDHDLTVSDLINWRYLLIEATPAERAAFVSNAKQYPRSVRKIALLLQLLEKRIADYPDDAHARLLRERAVEVMRTIGKDPAQFAK